MHRNITEQGRIVCSDTHPKRCRLGWSDDRPREQFSADSTPPSGEKRRDNNASVGRDFDV
ncbi:hypothetical protein [Halocatena pleomorpha]|uniref:Uncharacterized protein n=1 Tax=Halocatena pleomorpha TaxID=1785090 RepID=A0A3P3RLI5_9EURY|nr:hypothetical protein [Halocatena pleomorpha]RRJ33758.1 hypothetical protein EIK79_02915 [Halocatena pleomorpha]